MDSGAYITTMFDFFWIPNDFPGYRQAMECLNPLESVRILEEEMKKDIMSDTQLILRSVLFRIYSFMSLKHYCLLILLRVIL